jgi:hypothetical protein
MKKHSLIKIGGAALLGLLLLSPATKAFAEGGSDRQLTLASDCQKRADTVNAQIAEQVALKAANLHGWTSSKVVLPENVAALDKQYSEAIAALTAKRDQWVELAQWHKAEALEEQTVASSEAGTAQN